MLLAFFAYHRLIFLQHANVSKHFRQTFLHAFVPLYHLCQGRLLSVVQHLVDAVFLHNTLQISQTQSLRTQFPLRLMSMVSITSGFSFRLLSVVSTPR